MKITLDIPKEFERHFNNDRFKDSLKRIMTDVTDEIESDFSISGKYEIELCEMLIKAFAEAEPIMCAKWIDRYFGDRCGNCGYEISRTSSQYRCDYCPKCGKKMDGVIKKVVM